MRKLLIAGLATAALVSPLKAETQNNETDWLKVGVISVVAGAATYVLVEASQPTEKQDGVEGGVLSMDVPFGSPKDPVVRVRSIRIAVSVATITGASTWLWDRLSR